MAVSFWNIKYFIIGCIVGVFITDAFPSYNNSGEFSAKLSPGVPAKLREFPFIGYIQMKLWHIGAFSLVSTKVAVTSANCLEGISIKDVRGFLGDIQRGKGVEVEFATTYPIEPNDINDYNVIGILIFTRPVSYTDNIRPIALPAELPMSEMAKFASWGSVTEDSTPADTLQKLQFKRVNKYDYKACLPKNQDAIEVAKPRSEGFQTYLEDRGGPLVTNEYGIDRLVGVFSKTFKACPSVVFFTSVFHYRLSILTAIASINEE